MTLQERRRSGRERIEIKDLRNFVTVAEELNISRAAARLGMQQSPLSRSIRSLQDELGVRLIDTTGNRVALTAQGKKTLQEARHVLMRVSQLYPHARAGGDEDHVRLGFTYSAGGGLPSLLCKCRDDDRRRVVSITPACNGGASPFEFDILLSPERLPVPGVSAHELWREPLYAAVPAGLAISTLSSVTLAELGKVGTLYYPADMATILGYLPRNIQVSEVPYLDGPFVQGLTTTGHCTALVPSSLRRSLDEAGVLLKPVSDLKPLSICAYTLDASDGGLGAWLASLGADAP